MEFHQFKIYALRFRVLGIQGLGLGFGALGLCV